MDAACFAAQRSARESETTVDWELSAFIGLIQRQISSHIEHNMLTIVYDVITNS